MTDSNPPFPLAPAPWTCKCDTYWLFFSAKGPLPENVYHPLEASFGPFADPAQAGEFRGGMGMIQIVRYQETPVGPYNELIVIPGAFDVPEGKHPMGGKKHKKIRITRIYVDSKDTTYNGRKNWNIPKHLARFTFSNLSNPPRIKMQVFPPETSATTPFFTVTLQPFRWAPSFPFSTVLTSYLGQDTELVQPPLPASANEDEPEIVGTDKWQVFSPNLKCPKAQMCWIEVEQPGADEKVEEERELAKLWPKMGAWKVGLILEGSTLIV